MALNIFFWNCYSQMEFTDKFFLSNFSLWKWERKKKLIYSNDVFGAVDSIAHTNRKLEYHFKQENIQNRNSAKSKLNAVDCSSCQFLQIRSHAVKTLTHTSQHWSWLAFSKQRLICFFDRIYWSIKPNRHHPAIAMLAEIFHFWTAQPHFVCICNCVRFALFTFFIESKRRFIAKPKALFVPYNNR